ncbi:MAG TPA: helix-turn-helix domain-containing protein [Thermoanaerobaculia bacterium]|jgi:excisionase family DNA binding protein
MSVGINSGATSAAQERRLEKRYGIDAAAKLIGVSRQTIWREINDGNIGYHLIRGRKLIGDSEIDAYLAATRRGGR